MDPKNLFDKSDSEAENKEFEREPEQKKPEQEREATVFRGPQNFILSGAERMYQGSLGRQMPKPLHWKTMQGPA